MPQIVSNYIENEDFNRTLVLQKNINDAYIADMVKYAELMETARIMAAYNSIPAQLAKENHKFQYKIIKSGARAADYESPIEWLKAAGIIQKCIRTTAGTFPLDLYGQYDYFKIYLSDTGLLASKFNLAPNIVMSERSGFDSIKGALAENYVMGALVFNGFTPCYWESAGKAEVDFVIQNPDGDVIPIEVKSAEHVRSRSLNLYVDKYHPAYSIRISAKNFGFENSIKSVPLYAVFCISG
jgi:predicted AAA+ superfamily ATPase